MSAREDNAAVLWMCTQGITREIILEEAEKLDIDTRTKLGGLGRETSLELRDACLRHLDQARGSSS